MKTEGLAVTVAEGSLVSFALGISLHFHLSLPSEDSELSKIFQGNKKILVYPIDHVTAPFLEGASRSVSPNIHVKSLQLVGDILLATVLRETSKRHFAKR